MTNKIEVVGTFNSIPFADMHTVRWHAELEDETQLVRLDDHLAAMEEMRALLTAPVVERSHKFDAYSWGPQNIGIGMIASRFDEGVHSYQRIKIGRALVALPERKVVEKAHEPCDVPDEHEAIGWNACLDKVKELNQ